MGKTFIINMNDDMADVFKEFIAGGQFAEMQKVTEYDIADALKELLTISMQTLTPLATIKARSPNPCEIFVTPQ